MMNIIFKEYNHIWVVISFALRILDGFQPKHPSRKSRAMLRWSIRVWSLAVDVYNTAVPGYEARPMLPELLDSEVNLIVITVW